jgi:GNAT superfamily N-acetyltransferase
MKEIWKEFMDYHKSVNSFFSRTVEGHENFGGFALENIRSKDKWLVIIAESGGDIVGYCMAATEEYPPVFENPQYGYIMDMAVSRKHRRNNIGTQLYAKTAEWFNKKGINRIELHAVAANSLGLNFWRKMGFVDFMIRMEKCLQD